MGGGGGIVEVDETIWGDTKPRGRKTGRGFHHKEKILTLVEREGRARSFHVRAANAATLRPILREQIAQDSRIMTDEPAVYTSTKQPMTDDFNSHDFVAHGIGEYVRGDTHTNTIEGYFSILERGSVRTFHHVSPKHLKRYVGEFDFRYNHRVKLGYGDLDRTRALIRGISGKRLTYLPIKGREECCI